MRSTSPTLGSLVRGLRAREGWTLKQMSERSGIPVSTLSKVEHDHLTLTYDKLQQLSRRLGLRMSELFAEESDDDAPLVTARRSTDDRTHAVRVETPNYDYRFLHTELRQKQMVPVSAVLRTKSIEEFGALVRHAGEEFFYVTRGQVTVHTEFYEPVVLKVGQSMYIDSNMGHAYLVAEGCDEAEIVGVMTSGDEAILQPHSNLKEDQPARLASTIERPMAVPKVAAAR